MIADRSAVLFASIATDSKQEQTEIRAELCSQRVLAGLRSADYLQPHCNNDQSDEG